MSDYLEIERVIVSQKGVKVGVIVYRRFQPPVTAVFRQEWGGKIEYVGEENRADGSFLYASKNLSAEWIDFAQIWAKAVIRDRIRKRKKEIFWAGQPRLFY